MRIIGGKFKSRVLAQFDGDNVRPTSDRVKESLFNILFLKIRGKRVLDLFSGSGAIGIECLSRDAKEVVFNDFSKDSLQILRKNLRSLKVAEGESVKIKNLDYLLCLQGETKPFGLIFIDPPYKSDFGQKALEKIAERNLLDEDGIAVFESDNPAEIEVAGLQLYDKRKYGKTFLFFYQRSE